MNRSLFAVLLPIFSAVLFFSSFVHAALLAEYTFTDVSGNAKVAVPDAQPTNGSLSNMTQGEGLTDECPCADDVFWANHWMEATIADALTKNDFFEFTLSPDAGYQITLEDIKFKDQASSKGPTNYVIRSSLDNYASDIFTEPTHSSLALQTLAFSGANFTNQTTPITFRFYAFYIPDPDKPDDTPDKKGTWRIDNVQLHGSITLANRSCTDINLSSTSISENEPSGSPVGTFFALDPDSGDTHTYHLVVSPRGLLDAYSFYIDGNTLRTRESFNHEGKASLSIYVRCNDNRGGSCFRTLTISVDDVNEPPTDIRLSSDRADEGTPVGTLLGTFFARDPDPGDSHTFALVSGEGDTDNNAFSIEGDALKIGIPFDYETKSSYSIRVRTSDSGANAYERQFTVRVRDLNESPTDITLDSTAVDENQSVTNVGLLSATDENIGDTHTFELVAGEGDTDNREFWISSQNYLRTRHGFDYESKSSYSVRVRAGDGQGGICEKAFSVEIRDVSEPPSDIRISSDSVKENRPEDTEIGIFSVTDPDMGDSHAYALVSGEGDEDNGFFRITEGNILSADTRFDYEDIAVHSIRVRATDSQGETCEQSFEITVWDEDEGPFVASAIGSIGMENTGEIITADLAGVFSDPEDDPIEMKVDSVSVPDIVNATVLGNTLRLEAHGCGTSEIAILAISGGKTITDMLTLTISPLPGDADCDGSIGLQDAILALKMLTGEDVADIHSGADMSGDGKIGTEDLVSVLRQLVGDL
ncbi:MAG: hypothetical protein B6245_16730 [Desulfobacteraceae bacterium 4572_88]|nr:MAG: hypothetical protein B6245_16730 [Desulfobacteraceae bacterium 4572_88]